MSAVHIPLTATEKDLLGQVVNLAARKAANGVYLNQVFSASAGTQALIIVAIGEQADVLYRIIMKAAVTNERDLKGRKTYQAFEAGDRLIDIEDKRNA